MFSPFLFELLFTFHVIDKWRIWKIFRRRCCHCRSDVGSRHQPWQQPTVLIQPSIKLSPRGEGPLSLESGLSLGVPRRRPFKFPVCSSPFRNFVANVYTFHHSFFRVVGVFSNSLLIVINQFLINPRENVGRLKRCRYCNIRALN